jgi:hypothetical protein
MGAIRQGIPLILARKLCQSFNPANCGRNRNLQG